VWWWSRPVYAVCLTGRDERRLVWPGALNGDPKGFATSPTSPTTSSAATTALRRVRVSSRTADLHPMRATPTYHLIGIDNPSIPNGDSRHTHHLDRSHYSMLGVYTKLGTDGPPFALVGALQIGSPAH
jgi:hypothetical protein